MSVFFGASPARAADNTHPKLFIQCPKTCFEPYLRQELSYFDIVRDRHEAELVVQVVRQRSSSGGERFTVTLMSPRAETCNEFASRPGAQPEEMRKDLLGRILRLLYAELEAQPAGAAFELRLPRRAGSTLSQLVDPWDYWAVSPELKLAGEAQSSFYTGIVTSALNLRRITELHKLRLRLSYERIFSHYNLGEGGSVRGDARAWQGQLIYARSYGRHWAVGFASTERASQAENLTAHLHGGPVIELNLFPYSENASRQLRLAYQAGPWMSWYAEPTVFGKRRELRPYHALSVVADVNQPWGSLQWAVQLNSLIDQPEMMRLGSAAVGSLQLFEGFAVTLEGMGSYVHDQLSLRQRPLSDTELILGTAMAKTRFIVQLELGISYTFGSVHNTIVNPRFGRLDLQED
jgi:hypothetical protein